MSNLTPTDIVDRMYKNDAFSQWLGIQRIEDSVGKSVLSLTVRKEMLNGFSVAHGAICYALADSALAFAANARGMHSVSIETSISHTKKVFEGDVLIATAEEKNLTKAIAIYDVEIQNQNKETVALFKGTVYRTGKSW